MKEDSDQDKLPDWSQMDESQRIIVTRSLIQIKKWRFAAFAISTLVFIIQPIFNTISIDRNQARQAEITKTEKASENSLVLQKLLMSNLQDISAQLVSSQVERENLRVRVDELEKMQIQIKKEKDELEKKIKSGS